MAKYSALAAYLSEATTDSILLSFSQIEEIIETSLPPSARKHDAFWSNERSGTHVWAHSWQAVGWRMDALDMGKEIVTFKHVHHVVSDMLEILLPRAKENIYDLLGQIGISTSAWHSTSEGWAASSPKNNPHFCFNWAFGSLQEGFALCIWHDTLESLGGKIVFAENLRELANNLQAIAHNQKTSDVEKSRASKQSIRARAFDDVLNVCYSRGMPISVILTAGDRRSFDELGKRKPEVQARSLDPVKWYVHKYNSVTGEAFLVRGIEPEGVGCGWEDVKIDESSSVQSDDVQHRAIKIRRGQAKFRESLLAAYGRVCAVSKCRIVELLEAAHIKPYALEANYQVTNGILLRADIHTLFDLNLIGFDAQYRICLAPELSNSEYKCYEGKIIQLPEKPSEMPSQIFLKQRYQDFKNKSSF